MPTIYTTEIIQSAIEKADHLTVGVFADAVCNPTKKDVLIVALQGMKTVKKYTFILAAKDYIEIKAQFFLAYPFMVLPHIEFVICQDIKEGYFLATDGERYVYGNFNVGLAAICRVP
jgi:hypothetical protein